MINNGYDKILIHLSSHVFPAATDVDAMGRRCYEAAACKVIYRGVLGDGGLDGGDVVGVELHDVFKVPPNICAPVGLGTALWHIQAYLVILHESGLIR